MEAGTWAPHHRARKRGARRQDTTRPIRAAGSSRHVFLVLRYGRARGSKPGEQAASSHPCLASYFCVCRTMKMLHFQGKHWRSPVSPAAPQARGCRHRSPRLCLLRRRVQHPAPNPGAREVLGPVDVRGGWGGISVPASGIALPPACFTAVIPEDRKICACFSAAAEQLRNVSHHREPE